MMWRNITLSLMVIFSLSMFSLKKVVHMPVTCLVYVNIILVKNKSLDLYVRALKSPLILKFLKNLWSLVETVSFFAFCSGLIKNQIILVILPVCLCYHKEFIFCFLITFCSIVFWFTIIYSVIFATRLYGKAEFVKDDR